jgi:D-glycero-beta-D-manno-heptose 1-phosphate adenylyltransferase
VKGGDYTIEQIAGAKEVMANGGEVKIVPILEGFSTTGIIERMRNSAS